MRGRPEQERIGSLHGESSFRRRWASPHETWFIYRSWTFSPLQNLPLEHAVCSEYKINIPPFTAGCIFGGQAPSCTAHFAHEKIKNQCSATRLRCSDSSLMRLQRLERGCIGISGWKENRLISLSCSRRWAPEDPDAEQIVAKQWLPDYQPYRIKESLRTLQNVFKYF